MIELTLPFPPSLNRYYRTFQGRVLIAADGRAYRTHVGREVIMQLPAHQPLAGRIAVGIVFAAPDKRRRDADNLLKALLDSLTHAGLWADDSQIDDLRIVRGPVQQNNGCVVVQVSEIAERIV